MNQENSDVQKLLIDFQKLEKKLFEIEKKTSDIDSNVEVRIKILESEFNNISNKFTEIDKRLRMFEFNHDNRKERWNLAVNFVIQLIWVAMAAFLLSKLGLQPPL